MAFPETCLAHSISLAKKIKSGELKADEGFLLNHLEKSYPEGSRKKIVKLALELSRYDDVNKAAWSSEYRKEKEQK